MAKVFVGPDKHEFRTHKHLLRHDIPFFRAAFDNLFAEADENSMELPEDDPQVFALIVSWLYTKTVDLWYYKHSNDLLTDAQWMVPELVLAKPMSLGCALYILADKLQAINLCNLVIEAMHQVWTATPRIKIEFLAIKYVWEHSTEHSNLRKFLADIRSITVSRNSFEGYCLPKDLLVEIIRRSREYEGHTANFKARNLDQYKVSNTTIGANSKDEADENSENSKSGMLSEDR